MTADQRGTKRAAQNGKARTAKLCRSMRRKNWGSIPFARSRFYGPLRRPLFYLVTVTGFPRRQKLSRTARSPAISGVYGLCKSCSMRRRPTMCGRITQYRYPVEYTEPLGQAVISGLDPAPIGGTTCLRSRRFSYRIRMRMVCAWRVCAGDTPHSGRKGKGRRRPTPGCRGAGQTIITQISSYKPARMGTPLLDADRALPPDLGCSLHVDEQVGEHLKGTGGYPASLGSR